MATSLNSLLGGLYTGPSGYSGVSGYSGQGLSGFSGYSGAGQSGLSGYSGISGFSGPPITPTDFFTPYPNVAATNTWANNTVTSGQYFTPFQVQGAVAAGNFKYIGTFASASGTLATTAGTATTAPTYAYTHGIAFYSQGTGTQSTALYSFTSTAAIFQLQHSVSASANTQFSITLRLTYPVDGTTSLFTTQYSASTSNIPLQVSNLTAFTAFRNIKVPINTTFQAGEYWVAENYATARTGGGTQSIYYSKVMVVNTINSAAAAPGATANTQPFMPGLGSITTGGTAFASAVPFNVISSTSSQPALYFQLMSTNYSSL